MFAWAEKKQERVQSSGALYTIKKVKQEFRKKTLLVLDYIEHAADLKIRQGFNKTFVKLA